jgi:hypothetical protein
LLEYILERFALKLRVEAREHERYRTRLAEIMQLLFQQTYVISVEPV